VSKQKNNLQKFLKDLTEMMTPMHDQDHEESPNINSWRQLGPFGINPLTMESCAYGLRMLCDLSGEGATLLQNYFGLKESCFGRNWNSTVNNTPSVGSITLDTNCLLDLATFILLYNNYEVTVRNKYGVRGMSKKTYNSYKKDYPECFKNHTVMFHPNAQSSFQLSVDGRNVHAFTGRSK